MCASAIVTLQDVQCFVGYTDRYIYTDSFSLLEYRHLVYTGRNSCCRTATSKVTVAVAYHLNFVSVCHEWNTAAVYCRGFVMLHHIQCRQHL